MKINPRLVFFLIPLLFVACRNTKTNREPEVRQEEPAIAVMSPELTGTTWWLKELGTISLPDSLPDELRPFLVLEDSTNRAQGSDGCNRFSGSYSLEGDQLHFGPIASTKKFCPEALYTKGMGLVLEKCTRYDKQGSFLNLYRGDKLLARFTGDWQ